MIDTVILFAGHRIDEPGRISPRFSPECEEKARAAIRSMVQGIAADAQGPVLGMGGAADGGDILFHEICSESGVVSEVCLALPADEYLHTSVQPSWSDRFHHILKTHPTITLEPGTGDLWLRDHEWQLHRAYEAHARRIVLLALMVEGEPEVPGGTSGMIRMALENRLEVFRLDTRKICG